MTMSLFDCEIQVVSLVKRLYISDNETYKQCNIPCDDIWHATVRIICNLEFSSFLITLANKYNIVTVVARIVTFKQWKQNICTPRTRYLQH